MIAKEWKELPQAQKESYIERANLDRKRYKAECREMKAGKGKCEDQGPKEESDSIGEEDADGEY